MTPQANPAPAPEPMIQVYDDALAYPESYRDWALSNEFKTHVTGDEHWHGIALTEDDTLARIIETWFPRAKTTLTFFRQSPEGQAEPNFIHSDQDMGIWTAILYLNPEPDPRDGTTFWRHLPTGEVYGSARELDKNPADWAPWHRVEARFNRLLVFDSLCFHSRAIEANYGHGDEARLIQVAFGTWA